MQHTSTSLLFSLFLLLALINQANCMVIPARQRLPVDSGATAKGTRVAAIPRAISGSSGRKSSSAVHFKGFVEKSAVVGESALVGKGETPWETPRETPLAKGPAMQSPYLYALGLQVPLEKTANVLPGQFDLHSYTLPPRRPITPIEPSAEDPFQYSECIRASRRLIQDGLEPLDLDQQPLPGDIAVVVSYTFRDPVRMFRMIMTSEQTEWSALDDRLNLLSATTTPSSTRLSDEATSAMEAVSGPHSQFCGLFRLPSDVRQKMQHLVDRGFGWDPSYTRRPPVYTIPRDEYLAKSTNNVPVYSHVSQ